MSLNRPAEFPMSLSLEFARALRQLKESVPGLTAACVTTSDGFEIARLGDDAELRKFAAMASSMHALGDAISAEMALGTCSNVIVEGAAGKAVILTVPDSAANKLLIAAASADTRLALLLISARNCCEQLSGISNAHS